MLSCRLIRSLILLAAVSAAHPALSDVYELRTYTANEGKLEALQARFRNHTLSLFEKHGIHNVGYWIPVDKPRSRDTLIYVIKHKSREAARQSWGEFVADPEWQAVYKQSIEDGRLVAGIESVYMNATDYSPDFAGGEGGGQCEYELRIYTTNAGRLARLNARFREHTLALFEKHGIQSVAYWTPVDEPAASNTLIYMIRHASRDAARASWQAFAADEEWKRVARESQKEGEILNRPPESIYMEPTDYSPLK